MTRQTTGNADAAEHAHLASISGAEVSALGELVRRAIRFSDWAAGEGICPTAGSSLENPDEFLFAYSQATGDEDWATLADRAATRIGSLEDRERALEAALRPFVSQSEQLPAAIKAINKHIDMLTMVTVSVTKGQYLAGLRALLSDTAPTSA